MSGPKKLLFTLIFVLIAAVIGEILLGCFFWLKDKDLFHNQVMDFPYLYYLFEPNEDTNELGLKTKYSRDKPKDVFRVILVGGSVARGREPETSIAAFLEKELATQWPGRKTEVLNAGVSAFVIQQEFLLIQLILQYYDPDLIVSLDGYNDLLSYKINRFEETLFPLPPHNWSVFQVVDENENQKWPLSRFQYFFRNWNRAISFFSRQLQESNFDPDGVTQQQRNQLNTTYWKIAKDTYDFCAAKGIDYRHHIQPTKFYLFPGEDYPESSLEPLMQNIYFKLDSTARTLPWAASLTQSLYEHKEVFLDQCHVTRKGHQLIAKAIATSIQETTKQQLPVDSLNF